MEPQRFLRCLGQPALFAPTGEPIRFRTRKHLALLVYLAVESRSHRRDRLGELLWPRVTPTEARHSLATALSTLRPRLGPGGLETSRDQVQLQPGRVVLDLDRLEAGDILGTEITGPLEVAAFLDGFDIPDSAEFTHWKDRQQARLLPMIKDALLVLIDRCRRTGDSRQIERLADQMLAFDDLSEEAIRAKMEARAFAGDRLTALEIFEEWKAKLADELQAVPSDLLEGMAIRLRRRGWERTTLKNVPTVPTDQWRGRPFVGRAAEYKILYEIWEGVRKGVSGHALILGDSGIGKTTLVQRFATAAALQGAAISRVQCYDVEREIPYSTLNSLILGLLDRPGVSATAPEALAELARTVPSIRVRFPTIPAPTSSEGETARIRLTEAFLEMVTAIAMEQPVILVVDDLHVADDVSLAVLHILLRRAQGQPIMVVFVARPAELLQTSQAVRLRESAISLGIREIELSPLSEQESRDMLESLLEVSSVDPTLAERRALLSAAAGYPMVLELLVQDCKEGGSRSLALSVDAMTTELEGNKNAEAGYLRILNSITRTLDRTTHSVLNLAAILGPRLNDLGLYSVVDLTTGQTMASMAELVSRRVLRDSAHGLEFVNELVRAAAYIGVPTTLRRALHGSIADLLIQQHTAGRDNLDLEIAWHSIRAGRLKEATTYLLGGAKACVKNGALHAAERALSTAVPHLEGQERADAILLLVEVLQEQGRWQDSLNALTDPSAQPAVEEMLVFSTAAEHEVRVPTPDDISRDIARLRCVIEGSSDLRLRIRAARISAKLTSMLRDREVARALVQSIQSIPPPTNTDDLACLTACKAQLLYYAVERAACHRELSLAMQQVGNQGHINSTVASLQTGLGILAMCEGMYVEGKQALRRAYDTSIRLGNDTTAGNTAGQVALCCYRLGEYAEAIQWGEYAARNFRHRAFGGYLECQTARHTGSSYSLMGDERLALRTVYEYESRMPASSAAWMKQAWGFHKADILFYLGYRHEALVVANEAVGQDSPILYDWGFAGAFARWLVLSRKGTVHETVARLYLDDLIRDFQEIDALDQVEILCALLLFASGSSQELADIRTNVHERLHHLPLAITEQLSRLGVL